MTKSRIEYLDALKATSIVLVVFCHSVLLSKNTIIGNFFMSLSWAAVPCFMMTTGALMHQAKMFSWKKYLLKLFKTYLVFSSWRLIYLLVQIPLTDQDLSFDKLLQYLFLFTDLDKINTDVMWYMIAYIIVMLLYPVTYHLFQNNSGRKALVALGLIAGISGILLPSGNWLLSKISSFTELQTISLKGVNRIMPMTNYGNMIFYFVLGAYLYEYKEKVENKLKYKRWLVIIVMIIATLGLMAIKYLDTGTWRWGNKHLSNGYQHLLTLFTALGMYLFFAIYHLNKCYHLLSIYVGQFTIGIYYLHFIILVVCKATIYPALVNYYSFGLNCLKTAIVMFICVILTYFLRKVPIVYHLVK